MKASLALGVQNLLSIENIRLALIQYATVAKIEFNLHAGK
jgi:hypothetical protein